MFLGMSYAGISASDSTVSNDPISRTKLSNTIVGEMYATKDILLKFNWNIPTSWDKNTMLHAKYEKSLHAGNIEYSTSFVSSVKIKKRFVGDFEWQTIYEQPVTKNDDFKIEFYDFYEPTGREIEYAYVIVNKGIDEESAKAVVKSEFHSYFICGQNGESYPMIANVSNEYSYQRESQVIKTHGSKYPYVNNYGDTQYYGGTMTVSFFQFDEYCNLDAENAWKYRNAIDKFLTDGNPKIIKSFEGDIWMVNIVNGVRRTNSGHYQLVDQSFEWAEAGNPYSMKDLYENGFINTDVDVR